MFMIQFMSGHPWIAAAIAFIVVATSGIVLTLGIRMKLDKEARDIETELFGKH
jgi:hypothetical protein